MERSPSSPEAAAASGSPTAQRFVKEGGYVFITGRRQTELDKAVKLIGDNVTAVASDVTT